MYFRVKRYFRIIMCILGFKKYIKVKKMYFRVKNII